MIQNEDSINELMKLIIMSIKEKTEEKIMKPEIISIDMEGRHTITEYNIDIE